MLHLGRDGSRKRAPDDEFRLDGVWGSAWRKVFSVAGDLLRFLIAAEIFDSMRAEAVRSGKSFNFTFMGWFLNKLYVDIHTKCFACLTF